MWAFYLIIIAYNINKVYSIKILIDNNTNLSFNISFEQILIFDASIVATDSSRMAGKMNLLVTRNQNWYFSRVIDRYNNK